MIGVGTATGMAAQILHAVEEACGVRLVEVATGGGHIALHARLESGHWIVAVDEHLVGFETRIHWESEVDDEGETRQLGWSVGIYPHVDDEAGWFGGDSIADVSDPDASAVDLPVIIGKALRELMSR